jgi:ATP-independent RNA helicase DbpA
MRRVADIARELGTEMDWHPIGELSASGHEPLVPPMATLQILGGRKDKIRPGDVLGALTGEAGLDGAQVGKINVTESTTYVAVARDIAQEARRRLAAGKVKGKAVKVRILDIPGEIQTDAVSRANASIRRRPKP